MFWTLGDGFVLGPHGGPSGPLDTSSEAVRNCAMRLLVYITDGARLRKRDML